MTGPSDGDQGVTVPLIWVGGETLDVVKINQFLLQADNQGDMFLTVGTMTPPMIIADNAQDFNTQAAALGYVPIRTVAKLSLSLRNLAELVDICQRALAAHGQPAQREEGA